MTLESSLIVSWQPIRAAEEYAVTIVAVDSNGVDIFVGQYVPAGTTEVELETPYGALLVFATVHGYKICNKSNKSPIGFHIPPVV